MGTRCDLEHANRPNAAVDPCDLGAQRREGLPHDVGCRAHAAKPFRPYQINL